MKKKQLRKILNCVIEQDHELATKYSSLLGRYSQLYDEKQELEKCLKAQETTKVSTGTSTKPVFTHICPRCGEEFTGDLHVCFTIDTKGQGGPIPSGEVYIV